MGAPVPPGYGYQHVSPGDEGYGLTEGEYYITWKVGDCNFQNGTSISLLQQHYIRGVVD